MADRPYAHEILFPHRHSAPTAPFHIRIIKALHSPEPRVVFLIFRGAAKSTLAEEAAIIMALLGEAKNILVIGESEQRAVERLRAIKHELEYNDAILAVFGEQVGDSWAETRIVARSGVCFQAYGRGQSLRGVKHLQLRPDLILMDDIEDDEACGSLEMRRQVLRWFTGTVLPCMSKDGRVRMLATPLCDGREMDEKSLPLRLKASGKWRSLTIPIKFRDAETGDWRATWPDYYNMEWID